MEYTIQELCDQTGLPRRTIHFYIQQQILPAPQGSGLGAHYQEEHLLRLKLIPILRNQGLRLDGIREKFRSSPPAELEELFAKNHTKLLLPPPPAVEPILSIQEKRHPSEFYESFSLPHGILVFVPQSLASEMKQRVIFALEQMHTMIMDPVRGGKQ